MNKQENAHIEEMMAIMNGAMEKEKTPIVGKQSLLLTDVTRKEMTKDGETSIMIKLEFTTTTKSVFTVDIFENHYGLFIKQMALAFDKKLDEVAGHMISQYNDYYIQSKIAYGKTGIAYNNRFINEQKTIEVNGRK